MKKSATVGGVVALLSAIPAQAAVFVGGLFVDNQAYGSVFDGPDLANDRDQQFSNIFAAPSVQNAQTMAEATIGMNGAFFSAMTQTNLNFQSPDALTFDVTGVRSLLNTSANLAFGGGVGSLGYSFTTDTAYRYTVTYLTSGSEASTIANGFVGLGGSSGYLFLDFPALNDTGSFSGMIGPGEYYLQLIHSVVDQSYFYSPGAVEASNAGYFTFSLVAPGVPEPSTWAMLIAGFGMAGAGMRRRNARAINVVT